MAARPRLHQDNHNPSNSDLLNDLLLAPLPERTPLLRPVALRTQADRRRLVLSTFLQRTWFDTALTYAERLLVAVIMVFFGYWLVDGYGRDLWHAWQTPTVASAVKPFVPPPVPGDAQHPIPKPPDTTVAKVLPYTTPAMAQPIEPADYLVPGVMPALPPPGDQRPQRMVAPSIGLDSPVTEVFVIDGAWQVADYAVGYHHGTALPGEKGNTVMAGHAGFRGGVFRDLGSLAPGNDIWIFAGGWRYHYRVRDSKSVWPNEIDVMDPTPTPVLTLITCTAWDTQRLVVVADLVDARPDTDGS